MDELFNIAQYSKRETGAVSDWEIDCDGTDEWNLNNSTSAQELGEDSPSQESNSDLSLSDSTKRTYGVGKFSENDTPKQQYGEISKSPTGRMRNGIPMLLPPAHPVSPSPFKEDDKQQTMNETVSRQYSEQSRSINLDTLQLKMYPDSLPQDCDLEKMDSIWLQCLDSLPQSGTIRNGLLSAQDTLGQPSLGDDCCWLDSPGALSSGNSRPPGQSKLETTLKKLGILQKGEVVRPDFLERGLGLPQNYLNPSESRTAAQLLEDNGRQQEIFSTPELQRSHLIESYILKVSRRKKGEGTGHLFKKPITRKGKRYEQWWYQWVTPEGERRTKYVPKKLLERIKHMETVKVPLEVVLSCLGVNAL